MVEPLPTPSSRARRAAPRTADRLRPGPLAARIALAASLVLVPSVARALDVVVTSCASDADFFAKLASVKAAGSGSITFSCGASPVSIVLTHSALISFGPLLIDGGNKVTLSGGNSNALFLVGQNRSLTLKRLVITRGEAASGAVQVFENARFKATAVTFRENHASDSGGAISALAGAKLRLTRCKLVDDTADGSGGAIDAVGAELAVLHSRFESDDAGVFGGAIHANGSRIVVKQTQFVSSTAVSDGGAIYADHGSLTVRGSGFLGNMATDYEGGAIAGVKSHVVVRDTVFDLNGAGLRGGAISSKGVTFPDEIGILELTRVTFTSNAVAEVPGSIGGTIYSHAYAYLTDVSISGGKAFDGGAIGAEEYELQLSRSLLSGNGALVAGGAIRSTGTKLTMTNTTLRENDAFVAGGGLYFADADGTLLNSTLASNTSPSGASFSIQNADASRFGIQNSILDVDPATGDGCSGSYTSLGHNLFHGDTSCVAVGSDGSGDPRLGAPKLQGGETATVQPKTGSPAIDAGASTPNPCPADDQRGFARPQGLACDIGATERCAAKPAAAPVLTYPPEAAVLSGSIDFAWDPAPCGERYLLDLRSGGPGGTVYLQTDVFFGHLGVSPPSGAYAWRVKVCNVEGCKVSDWRSLTVS
jgi:predicted outer membrane repeat protein